MESYCFDGLLAVFGYVASCAVVKSALTQSSYLPVFSGLWGFARGIYSRFFWRLRVYEYAIPLNFRCISGVEEIGKSIRINMVHICSHR